jgi:hypothetical protein
MLVILVGLLAAFVALLAVPVHLQLEADPQTRPHYRWRASWLFGLVQGDVGGGDERKPTRKKNKKKDKKPSNRRQNARRGMAFVREAGGVARLRVLLADLLAGLHPHVERMRIELGLGDPADTGRAWALLGPVSVLLAQRFDGRVRLEPNFVEPKLVLEGRAQLRVVPLQLIGIVLGYVFAPSTWRGVYAAARA